MLRTRVIPCLLLKDHGLVKTVKYKNPTYIGDPINAIKIFNEKEVDELMLLDITATVDGRGPSFDAIRNVASECFMPLAYGGGIRDINDIRRILAMGVEKVVLNSIAINQPQLIRDASQEFGSQAIVVSIDVKRKIFGGYEVMKERASKSSGMAPVSFAVRAADLGAGEILLSAVHRDGTLQGFDTELIRQVASSVDVPVVAIGGAGKFSDFIAAKNSGAAAVAAGSIFVFKGPHRAVLISFPSNKDLQTLDRYSNPVEACKA